MWTHGNTVHAFSHFLELPLLTLLPLSLIRVLQLWLHRPAHYPRKLRRFLQVPPPPPCPRRCLKDHHYDERLRPRDRLPPLRLPPRPPSYGAPRRRARHLPRLRDKRCQHGHQLLFELSSRGYPKSGDRNRPWLDTCDPI